MKKVIALLASFLVGTAGATTTHHEASMNFDLENVRPFLEQVNHNLFAETEELATALQSEMVAFAESLGI